MNLKVVKTLGLFLIFLLCFPLHFIYDFLPNTLFSIFAPVNESIWEHMKLIFTSYVFYGIFDYLLLKKNKISFNNFLLQLFLIPIVGIILYLLIFIPIYNNFGENMLISIGLLFLIIIFEQVLSYYFLKFKEIKYQNIIGIVGIIITYIIFGYLTYNPVENYIFFDISNSKYGINIYVK